EFIGDVTEEWLGSNAKSEMAIQKFPVAIQRRCVQAQLLRRGVPADFALVERLRTSRGRPLASCRKSRCNAMRAGSCIFVRRRTRSLGRIKLRSVWRAKRGRYCLSVKEFRG